MGGRSQQLFACLVGTALLYILLGPGAAFAAAPVLSRASSPQPAIVVRLWGQVDDTCDEVDDTSDQNACEENVVDNSSEQAHHEGDETANQAGETTNETADRAGDTTNETADQASETTNETADQASDTTKETASQAGDTTKETGNQAGQGASSQSADETGQTTNGGTPPQDPNPFGWVVDFTNRVVDLVSGWVGSLADFFAGRDISTGASDRSGNGNPHPEGNSQLSQVAEAGNDESGGAAAPTSAGNPTQGDAPEPWWSLAWLPFTGSQWVLLVVAVSLILICLGLALRSLRRRRRPPTVRV
jgi:hypothetical protein